MSRIPPQMGDLGTCLPKRLALKRSRTQSLECKHLFYCSDFMVARCHNALSASGKLMHLCPRSGMLMRKFHFSGAWPWTVVCLRLVSACSLQHRGAHQRVCLLSPLPPTGGFVDTLRLSTVSHDLCKHRVLFVPSQSICVSWPCGSGRNWQGCPEESGERRLPNSDPRERPMCPVRRGAGRGESRDPGHTGSKAGGAWHRASRPTRVWFFPAVITDPWIRDDDEVCGAPQGQVTLPCPPEGGTEAQFSSSWIQDRWKEAERRMETET